MIKDDIHNLINAEFVCLFSHVFIVAHRHEDSEVLLTPKWMGQGSRTTEISYNYLWARFSWNQLNGLLAYGVLTELVLRIVCWQ